MVALMVALAAPLVLVALALGIAALRGPEAPPAPPEATGTDVVLPPDRQPALHR